MFIVLYQSCDDSNLLKVMNLVVYRQLSYVHTKASLNIPDAGLSGLGRKAQSSSLMLRMTIPVLLLTRTCPILVLAIAHMQCNEHWLVASWVV